MTVKARVNNKQVNAIRKVTAASSPNENKYGQ